MGGLTLGTMGVKVSGVRSLLRLPSGNIKPALNYGVALHPQGGGSRHYQLSLLGAASVGGHVVEYSSGLQEAICPVARF